MPHYDSYFPSGREAEADPNVLNNFLACSERVPSGGLRSQALLCVDERASTCGKQIDESDEALIYLNLPGAGIEFISDDDILRMITRSNGVVDIYAHRFCGWGVLKFNEFLRSEDEEAGEYSGHVRVLNLIEEAIYDPKFQEQYNIQGGEEDGIMEEAALFIDNHYLKGGVHDLSIDHEWEEFFQRAFVYGEALDLQRRIEAYYSVVKDSGYPCPQELVVSVLIDPLEGPPHKHIANAAVANCTGRSITSRFQVDGADAFFADVNDGNILQVLGLIFQIMEGDHSDTSETHHKAYVFCEGQEQLQYLQEVLQDLTGITRDIFLYLVEE